MDPTEIKAHLANLTRLAAVRARLAASGLGDEHNPGLYRDTDHAITRTRRAARRAIRTAAADQYQRARLFTALDTILESAAARERFRTFAEAVALVGDEDGRRHLELPPGPVPSYLRDVAESADHTRETVAHEISAHTRIITTETDRIVQTITDHHTNGTTS